MREKHIKMESRGSKAANHEDIWRN